VVRAHFESENAEEIRHTQALTFLFGPVAAARAGMEVPLIATGIAYRMLVFFQIVNDRPRDQRHS
jgi:hypothetical protein